LAEVVTDSQTEYAKRVCKLLISKEGLRRVYPTPGVLEKEAASC
jgi:hypothetical protein